MKTPFVENTIFNNQDLQETPYLETRFMSRHIRWIRKPDRPVILKVMTAALVALECLVLALSVIGIIFLYKGICEFYRQRNAEAFTNTINKKIESGELKPPDIDTLPLISKTTSFNHTNYYVIHEGVIWTKPIKTKDGEKGKEEWKPIYFGRGRPVEIQSDGANLIVINEKGCVHYKKVIEERRIPGENKRYSYSDKSTINNWESKWFSLPFFHLIANMFTGRLLTLPEDRIGWAISHRGTYNHYQTDAIGQKHNESVGTTHLYLLEKGGQMIRIFDPWIHKSAKIHISTPSTANSTFEAVNIAASASTVMVIGYEFTPMSDGKIKKELKVYTRFVDFDILGWNPGVKYDYPGNNPSRKARVIPMPGWMEHPIDQTRDLTKEIRVVQNGEDNNARILLVEGKSEEGESGYYWKRVDEPSWHFTENSHVVEGVLELNQESKGQLSPLVKDYTGEVDGIKFELKAYGEGTYFSRLKLKEGEHHITTVFNRRKTLMTLLGWKTHKHEIALPEEKECQQMKSTLKKLFGHRKVIKASVEKLKNGALSLSNGRFRVILYPA